jgi:hypothetical protein
MRFLIFLLVLSLPLVTRAENQNYIVCVAERGLQDVLTKVSISSEPGSSYLKRFGCKYKRLPKRLIFSRLNYFDTTNQRLEDKKGYIFSVYEVSSPKEPVGQSFFTSNSMYPAEFFRVLWDSQCVRGKSCSYLLQTQCPSRGQRMPRKIIDNSVIDYVILSAKCDVQVSR